MKAAAGGNPPAAISDKSQLQPPPAAQPLLKRVALPSQHSANVGYLSLAPVFNSSAAFPSAKDLPSPPASAASVTDSQLAHAHSAIDSCESMLRHWSQSLMTHTMVAPSFDLMASHNYHASILGQSAVSNSSLGVPPTLQSDQRATEFSLPHQCATSNSHKFVVVGDAVFHLKGCNCKLSNCLKGYCECHAAGARCTARCRCINCHNLQLHSHVPDDARTESAMKKNRVESVLSPAAFERKFYVEGDSVFSSKGCNCKHSRCLKGYCECHAAGARCTARCRCLKCENGKLVVDNSVISS